MQQLIMSLIPKLIVLFALVSCSLILRQFVILSGQYWVRSFSHTATLLLLPMITYTITSVISGDIALSLGLVGALSIVRFRNPVKSPFELAVYFAVISFGIAASVTLLWLFLLTAAISGVLLFIYCVDVISKKIIKKPYFTASFSEGNSLNLLEVTCSAPLDNLFNHYALVNFNQNGSQMTYRLADHDKQNLLEIADKLSKIKTVTNIQFNVA